MCETKLAKVPLVCAWLDACVCVHAGVVERGLGSVPVSMHSPQSKVNTAALFSSQPSAGSPQARARDHTPRPHTHTHTHIHTLPRPLRRSFHILEYTQTTQHQLGPLARNLAELSFCPACVCVCVCVCVCLGGGGEQAGRQAICVFVHVYFQDVGEHS